MSGFSRSGWFSKLLYNNSILYYKDNSRVIRRNSNFDIRLTQFEENVGYSYTLESKETLQESILILDEKIRNIFEKTEATHYVIFISNSPYFRHKIDPLYKSQRSKYTSPLKTLCLNGLKTAQKACKVWQKYYR